MAENKLNQSFLIKLIFSAKMALHGLFLNPLRTTLTVLGVTIGVASVVSLMGIGEGARVAVMEQFESLGTNVIKISVHNPIYEFEPEISEDLVTRVQGMDYSSPVVNVETQLQWKRSRVTTNVMGVNEQFKIIRDYEIIDGEFISQYHVKLRSNVAVLGYNIANSIMGGRSPVGRYITLNGESYEVIGVLGEKGAGKSDNVDNKIIIPYTCAQKIAEKRTVEEIWCKANSQEDARLAIVQLGRIIKKKYNLGENGAPSGGVPDLPTSGGGDAMIVREKMMMEGRMAVSRPVNIGGGGGSALALPSGDSSKDVITITSLNQMVQEADEANRVMSLLLGGIAAVSLLVGGLGIMNIMLVAVSERTSEIGLRRALGAQKNDLLTQFLLEALFISIIGSFAGILLGVGGTALFENYGFDTVVSIKAIGIASFVAICSGIVFGVYPAFSASSIPPVVALRRQ